MQNIYKENRNKKKRKREIKRKRKEKEKKARIMNPFDKKENSVSLRLPHSLPQHIKTHTMYE